MLKMRRTAIVLVLAGICAANLSAQPDPGAGDLPEAGNTGQFLDSNTAFYQGSAYDYVVYAPAGFVMVIQEPIIDGYSLAFVPETDRYDSCGVMITAVFYDLARHEKTGQVFEKILSSDTADMRRHYGENLVFRSVDSVLNANDEIIPTLYLEDKTRFIPNVMVSYYDGDTEMLIFELSIGEGYPRFLAEGVYIECLRKFKRLKHGQLEP
ncbi:MAG: hypothetical protein OEW00_05620 [candidate division Zixibacteria bacterium]|nr:hypothetical protein [candidate division Zixibacteria bacterium]